jgi:hypothetical protein
LGAVDEVFQREYRVRKVRHCREDVDKTVDVIAWTVRRLQDPLILLQTIRRLQDPLILLQIVRRCNKTQKPTEPLNVAP